jgi:hypothetical protein
MIPSAKPKESVATRRVPPPTAVSLAAGDAASPAKKESAQKFMVWPEDRRERIAAKAYELWEQRGCRHGYDLEDWCEAEVLVIQSLPEAPK